MEYDIFKVIVSVKDITDRGSQIFFCYYLYILPGKSMPFVTCRVRFNHMVNSSLVNICSTAHISYVSPEIQIPFKQGIQFALTVLELNKPLEFSFDRESIQLCKYKQIKESQ